MTWNFSAVAFDQILNNAAKLRQMSGGQFNVPHRLPRPQRERAPGRQPALARDGALLRDTSPASRCSRPRSPADAKGLLKTAIRDDNPVLFIESRDALQREGRGPRRRRRPRSDRARRSIVREGNDVTIVAWSRIDARRARGRRRRSRRKASTWRSSTFARSARSTRTPIVDSRRARRTAASSSHEGWPYGGVGAEIADRVQRLAFDELDAPILRVAHARRADAVQREARAARACPQAARVIDAVKRASSHRGREI